MSYTVKEANNITVAINGDGTVDFSQNVEWAGFETIEFTVVLDSDNTKVAKVKVVLIVDDVTRNYDYITTQHPRMFVNSLNLSELRNNMTGNLSSKYNWLRTNRPLGGSGSGDFSNSILTNGFLYNIETTQKDNYASTVASNMETLLRIGITEGKEHSPAYASTGLGIGYDLIYPYLVANDIDEHFKRWIEIYMNMCEQSYRFWSYADWQNYGTRLQKGIAMGSLATYGEIDYGTYGYSDNSSFDFFWDTWSEGKELFGTNYNTLDSIARTDGTLNFEQSYMSTNLSTFVEIVEAWDTSTLGTLDYWNTSRVKTLENVAEYIIYRTRPDDKVIAMGDITNWNLSLKWVNPLAIIANRFQNGYAQDYVNDHYALNQNDTGNAKLSLVHYLLGYDSNLAPIQTTTLPLAANLGGDIFIRSGWESDDTVINYSASEYWGYHTHNDVGHFSVYRLGELLSDTGHYYLDSLGSTHRYHYYSRSIAHNVPLVYDASEGVDIWPSQYGNDGGQRLVQVGGDADSSAMLDSNSTRFNVGTLTDFEAAENYTYINHDMTNAYNGIVNTNYITDRVTSLNRQFIYAEEFIVVVDKIVTDSQNYDKIIPFHMGKFSDKSGEPQIWDGNNWNSVETGITNNINNSLIRWDYDTGRMFLNSLFPVNKNITTIGGSGFENYVFGVNYPFKDNAWNVPFCEQGAWRVDVQSSDQSTDDVFLNILYPTSAAINETPSIVRISDIDGNISSNNMIGVVLNNSQVVLFGKETNNSNVVGDITYTITSAETVNHILTNMQENTIYTVVINNVSQQGVSNNSGILTFNTTVGQTNISVIKGASVIRANVDGQNGINTIDAMLTLRNSLGLNMSQTSWQVSDTTGDVNCDDNSNAIDAVLLLRYSLGLDMSETGWCG